MGDGEWHYWGFLERGGFTGPVQVDLIPSQQFTGLKDKNGKEIYDGDIVCTEHNPGNHENCPKQFHDVVEYKDGAYSTFNPANGYEYGSAPNECEVLGNIYENPELLSN